MKPSDELKELRGLGVDVVAERVGTLKEELMKLRFRHSSGQLDHTAQLSTIKRRIARVNTVLREMSAAESR